MIKVYKLLATAQKTLGFLHHDQGKSPLPQQLAWQGYLFLETSTKETFVAAFETVAAMLCSAFLVRSADGTSPSMLHGGNSHTFSRW